MPKIHFIDCTNRDVVQASRMRLAKLQKTMVNIYLAQLGIHQSEFAFPYTRHEQNYVRANLELQRTGAMGDLVLEGWCRAIIADVDKSLPTGIKDLNLSISTSDQMIRRKFSGKLDRDSVIKEMVQAVGFAKKNGVRAVGVNAEDASRTDMGYLVEFGQAAREAGADRLRYCDTLGYDNPFTIYSRMLTLAERVRLPLEQHCHNDLGMAVANAVAGAKGALDGGVDAYINTAVNGFGERAGQTDLLSCILAVTFSCNMEAYQIGDKLNLKVAARLGRYVAYAFHIPIPINQPGIGANAFAHEAGIHADGALKDRRNYELYDYELLGLDQEQPALGVPWWTEPMRQGRLITTGEYGGLSGFKHVYEQIGISFPDDTEAERVLELVRYANAHTQLPLTDDELRFIASHPEQVRQILTMTP